MWSGTVGNAIDQSDYRIDESSMSSEWVEDEIEFLYA